MSRTRSAYSNGLPVTRASSPCGAMLMHKEALSRFQIQDETTGVLIGRQAIDAHGLSLQANSPIDGTGTAQICCASPENVNQAIDAAADAFKTWRTVPPRIAANSSVVFGSNASDAQSRSCQLVSWKPARSRRKSLGEVQEMIDICDFAVGPLPAALRPDHRQRAAGPSHDGAVASAGADRRHHRVQFPRRRLGVECDARPGLRRHGRLEAIGKNAADGARLPAASWPR